MERRMTPDAVVSWVDQLPPRAALYARLARFDRPAGIWLLFWPCLMGAFLSPPAGWWPLWPLFLLGAVAMRAAGCVYNDIVDRDLDAQVARTASRPVASGAVSVRNAWGLLALLLLAGFGVFLALPFPAKLVALGSLLLVAAYPFMKRLTWWPQAWLGLTFNWGIPVGWAAAEPALRADPAVMLLVYAAAIAWTLGYDSIYAAQDMEDDALAGVKSSARALGPRLKPAVGAFYAICLKLLALALLLWTGNLLLLLALVPAALHFAWQFRRFRPSETASALAAFRSNQVAGMLLVLPLLLAALAMRP
jgi:4-hydroxybenzoate polyprenyltransferase